MSRGFYLVLIIAISYALWTHWLKPTPDLADLSHQASVAQGVQQGSDFTVTELEHYSGDFRILGRKDYDFGTEARFSPMDFAVGWGVMADPKVYSQVQVSQSNRWYYWHVTQPPISLRDIETHSANMHIVPANAQVAAALKEVKPDDLVHLDGALVEIDLSNGWHWRSSLSREDTGAGACELMRVDEVHWL